MNMYPEKTILFPETEFVVKDDPKVKHKIDRTVKYYDTFHIKTGKLTQH